MVNHTGTSQKNLCVAMMGAIARIAHRI